MQITTCRMRRVHTNGGWSGSHIYVRIDSFKIFIKIVRINLIFFSLKNNNLWPSKISIIFILKFQLILKLLLFTNVKIVAYFQQFSQLDYWIYSIQTMSFMCAICTQDILQFNIVVCFIVFWAKSVGINFIYAS